MERLGLPLRGALATKRIEQQVPVYFGLIIFDVIKFLVKGAALSQTVLIFPLSLDTTRRTSWLVTLML